MDRESTYHSDGASSPLPGVSPDDRLRMLTLTRGDIWPERESCELILVLSCRSNGFVMTGLEDNLCVGELALLPLGNGLIASAEGRVLSARMTHLEVPAIPQRLRDRLIGQLLRRAWASAFTASEIVDPTLQLIEVLAASKVRDHQEQLDLRDRLDPRLARALDYIDAHLGEDLSVADLAQVAHLSAGQFSRKFKMAMGEPVWAYVTRQRCHLARELLLTTQLPIAEIAYSCGFAHQGHMTTCFRREFGVTPGTARSN